ncbi:XRE family transcriptional regulator [Dankookia rubra]|uniref:XRE family transcriptional regulator n=1 Tax=Dankookia rubra TaxID=1442381 RepID=A0A4R5Q5G7_9PROT|nr:helix-turn-helix transcriptional regulator [Dankookia rubra]TDH58152.1 XRE family transcriptional regulator [Dankookia rubra]
MTQAGFTAAQCRAARAAVQWSQDELAERARVSRATLVKFENGSGVPHTNNLTAIRAAFEAEGFRFALSEADGQASISYVETWK